MEPGLWVQLTEAEMAASTDADGRSLRHHRGCGWSIGAARSTHPGLPVAGESQERNSVMVVLFAGATGVISHQAVPSSADFCMT
jgi:hypothetical protein